MNEASLRNYQARHRVRRRRQYLISGGTALAFLALYLLFDGMAAFKAGHANAGGFFACVVPLVYAGVWMSWKNWRCPRCNRYLGKGDSRSCRRCGLQLVPERHDAPANLAEGDS